MEKAGLLTFENFGNALPVTNPSYGKPPYHMRAYENLSISYETDYECAAPFLPEPLEFADEKPIVNIAVRRIPFSTFGAALEASISFNVRYKGEDWKYYPCYYVGSDGTENETGMLMGREYYGNAKKVAKIELSFENNTFVGKVSRPGSVPLFTLTMSPREHLPTVHESKTNQINLRYIPGIEENAPPDICQLIGQICTAHPVLDCDGLTDTWSGIGSVTFHTQSSDEPWQQIKANRIVSASYGRWHNYVPHGFVLYNYLQSSKEDG